MAVGRTFRMKRPRGAGAGISDGLPGVEQDYRDADVQDDPPPAPKEVAAREETRPARLRLDFQVPLHKGIAKEGLDAILTAVLRTGWDFRIQAHEAWGL